MKDFALQLEGCSKEDRKKVIELAKSVGFRWRDGDRFKTKDFQHLMFRGGKMVYWGSISYSVDTIYQMPRDWDKIQEAFGVKVEPKDGEVWKFTYGNRLVIVARIKGEWKNNLDVSDCHSMICTDGEFMVGVDFGLYGLVSKERIDPERLIEEERKNGLIWDGEKLARIEYVEILNNTCLTYCPGGVIFKVLSGYGTVSMALESQGYDTEGGYQPRGSIVYIRTELTKPSTLEAYEAQQARNMDYPTAARAMALYLDEFCDKSEPYPNMLRIACVNASKEIKNLRNENERLRAKLNQISEVCDS